MGIAQTIALNWRAITAFVMAAVQLATATKLLPVGSEDTANTLIATAGGVIGIIAGGSYAQNIATSRAITAQASAVEATTRTVEQVAAAAPSDPLTSVAGAARDAAVGLTSLSAVLPK
jgi:hypothetical protein